MSSIVFDMIRKNLDNAQGTADLGERGLSAITQLAQKTMMTSMSESVKQGLGVMGVLGGVGAASLGTAIVLFLMSYDAPDCDKPGGLVHGGKQLFSGGLLVAGIFACFLVGANR